MIETLEAAGSPSLTGASGLLLGVVEVQAIETIVESERHGVSVCRRSARGKPPADVSRSPPAPTHRGVVQTSRSHAARRPSCSLWPLSHVARAKPGSPRWPGALVEGSQSTPGAPQPRTLCCQHLPTSARLPTFPQPPVIGSPSATGCGAVVLQGGPRTSSRELARHVHSQAPPRTTESDPRSGARKLNSPPGGSESV